MKLKRSAMSGNPYATLFPSHTNSPKVLLEKLSERVTNMRNTQIAYFERKEPQLLTAAKNYEGMVDGILKSLNSFFTFLDYSQEAQTLIDKTNEMRKAQKEYFRNRTQENLIAAKYSEKYLDIALTEYKNSLLK